MSIPSLSEWRKNNPGKGANDYYSIYSTQNSQSQENNHTPTSQTIINNYYNYVPKNESKSINFISIISSIIIIIAFFLPWINVRMFGIINLINKGGYQIPETAKNLFLGDISLLINSIYLIPILAIFAIITEITQSIFKSVAEMSVVAITAYWSIVFYQLVQYYQFQMGININVFHVISIGYYLTVLGCILYIVDIIVDFFK